MALPEFRYMAWAKSQPRARINLARSGIEPCPVSLLGVSPRDIELVHPPGYGWQPLRKAIARRYRVSPDQVLPVSGGASLANWLAIAAAVNGDRRAEVIVERPTYEQLLRIPELFRCKVRRLERKFEDGYAIDLDRFASLVNRRTRAAVVSSLHNPSGAQIDLPTLRRMAAILREVGGWLVVDEVYLECLFGRRAESTVHAGSNVVATNSLTKAYGLDGLRAGWLLGPREIIRRAGQQHDLLCVNGVAPGEQLALQAFRRLPAVRARADRLLQEGLAVLVEYLAGERRLQAVIPPGGNVVFPRLPRGVDSEALAAHLHHRYSTLVVPGRFFESSRHIRLSFGCGATRLTRGLRNLSRALDALMS